MIRRIFIIAILPFLIFADGSKEERDALFKQAVSAYAAEDYESALSIFRSLENSGTVSWELFYNIANVHYRKGELGPAIRYWEKAALLAPDNPDIAYNLRIARERLNDKVVLPEMFPLFRGYQEMQKRLPLDRMIRLIGYLLAILVLIPALYRLRRHLRGKAKRAPAMAITLGLAILILLLSVITLDTLHERRNSRHGIILTERAEIYSEPDGNSVLLFSLHEGSKVRISKEIGGEWARISYFDDKIGWVKSEYLGKIEE